MLGVGLETHTGYSPRWVLSPTQPNYSPPILTTIKLIINRLMSVLIDIILAQQPLKFAVPSMSQILSSLCPIYLKKTS